MVASLIVAERTIVLELLNARRSCRCATAASHAIRRAPGSSGPTAAPLRTSAATSARSTPGRWQASHFSWKIGATSLVNVTCFGGVCASLVAGPHQRDGRGRHQHMTQTVRSRFHWHVSLEILWLGRIPTHLAKHTIVDFMLRIVNSPVLVTSAKLRARSARKRSDRRFAGASFCTRDRARDRCDIAHRHPNNNAPLAVARAPGSNVAARALLDEPSLPGRHP